MTEQSTVRSVTFDLLRSLGLTTVFGNPGSTEEPFLQECPDDCRAVDVATAEELEREFKAALSADTTTVIVVPTQPQKAML
jgi:thiamine pyrophosphate-dependent acetolactate synthase large subunit-like protein